MMSVMAKFFSSAFKLRNATSAAVQAAFTTSAFRPVAGASFVAPTIKVSV